MSKNYFVHPQALCESEKIGEKTRVWAFAHVLPNAVIGTDCNVCDHVFIENDVAIGDRVTIKCGVQIWDGIEIQNDVFIGPNVTFTNDKYPKSKIYPEAFLRTVVEEGASLGANSTILPGLKIGRGAMIGAGSVVTRNVPPFAKVLGNPARIVGYQNDALHESLSPASKPDKSPAETENTYLHFLTQHRDMRGSLSVGEFEKLVPFTAKRFFIVNDVPSSNVRGEHAHLKCHQFLICLAGSVTALIDDGIHRQTFLLDSPNKGLYMPPLTWGSQFNYSKDAVLLVFASDLYDSADYIREYDTFREAVVNRAR